MQAKNRIGIYTNCMLNADPVKEDMSA